MIRLEGVSAGYGARDVIAGVGLRVEAGERVGLLGANGVGKTTLLRVVSGTLAPRAGRVEVLGRPGGAWRRRDLARRLAVVPQRPAFPFPYLVEEYVALGRIPHLGLLGRPGAADRAAVEAALAACDLERLRAERVDRISAGEAARAALARALAQGGDLLLLDEPIASLDLAHQISLLDTLRRLAAAGRTVVAAVHDVALAAAAFDRLVLLAGGRVAADGPPERVVTEETLAAHLGVRARVRRDDETGRLVVIPLGAA